MRRRELITLLGGAAASWSLAARAQQAGKLPTIGFLGADASAFSPYTAAFVARLHELGWIEGSTIAIEYRWSQGRSERYAEIAAEFVRLNVDVIVTVGSAVPIVRRQRLSPLSSQWRATRSAAAWSQAWRNRAVTSLDYRSRRMSSPASD
jgi:putative ABC transport system substrate-binding protein